MENGLLIFILVLVAFVCFIMYYELPSKYKNYKKTLVGL